MSVSGICQDGGLGKKPLSLRVILSWMITHDLPVRRERRKLSSCSPFFRAYMSMLSTRLRLRHVPQPGDELASLTPEGAPTYRKRDGKGWNVSLYRNLALLRKTCEAVLLSVTVRGKGEMAKLGTKQRPAVVRVQTEARAGEILQLCNAKGWQVIVGIEPDKAENIADVQKLLSKPVSSPALPTRQRLVSGNDYCPCGSGRKFKNCCGLQKPN